MKTVIVSGVIANKLGNGGAAWTRLSWAAGLARLGYRVVFIEQIAPENCVDEKGNQCEFERSANLQHFRQTTQAHGLGHSASLICGQGEAVYGLSLAELEDAAAQADFLLNISGHLSYEPVFNRCRRRVYLDLDPGYTQYWYAQGHLPHLPNHDHFFTVGLNIGQRCCDVPTSDIHWQPTLQPVVLSEWPLVARGKASGSPQLPVGAGPLVQ